MGNKDVVRVSQFATRSTHERWTVIDQAIIDQKVEDAKRNLRKREIHNLHSSDEDAFHRMLNSIQPGSYLRPHRHLDPPKDKFRRHWNLPRRSSSLLHSLHHQESNHAQE